MYAFDANSGSTLWIATLPGQYFFTAPPAALNGIVYTSGAGSGGTVYAVRESDGKVLWTASVMNGDNSSPVVTGTGVYVSYVCPQTYKFAPKTGGLIWHYSGPCEGGGGATPVLYQGLLYVRDWSSSLGHNGDILNATTGAVVGSFDANFAPAFVSGKAFYVQSNSVKAVNTTYGTTLWTAIPPSGDSYSTPPIVVDGVVYIGTNAGKLLGYRQERGFDEHGESNFCSRNRQCRHSRIRVNSCARFSACTRQHTPDSSASLKKTVVHLRRPTREALWRQSTASESAPQQAHGQ